MFKIGEFAQFTRVSVKMLRHYDDLGLLKPARVDPDSGYRYYSADQLPRLNRIIALKDLGFTLPQIRQLLDERLSADELRGMLRLKQAEVEQQMVTEQQRLARIDTRLRLIEQELAGPSYEVVVRPLESCLIASIRRRIDDDASLPALFEELEAYVARYRARAAAPPLTIYHPASEEGESLDVEAAVPVNAPLPTVGLVVVRALEGVLTAACVVHTGSYETLDHAATTLLRWIEVHAYQVAGSMREVYLRFGADNQGYRLPSAYLAAEAREFVTELQIPVVKKLTVSSHQ
jgi:DNA-binding transcriptional MerR regulator